MTRMTDEQLDHTITRHLTWRATQLQGIPDAQGMAWRIAGERLTRRPRRQRTVAVLVATAVVTMAAVATLIVAGSRPPPGPLTNGPLVVANALGWNGIDPASGAAVQLGPCDGQCEEAMDPRLSADGQTVFFVDPSHDGGDLRSDQPGWAIWRWDRLGGSVRRVVGCDEIDCTLRRPIPSPDGHYLAYGQGDEAPSIPMPPLDEVVVVEAETGREVRRLTDLVGAEYWVPFPSVAWDAVGQLLVTDLGTGQFRYRRIDVTTGAEADVTLPWDGDLESSPDGTTLVMTDEADPWRLWLLDDRFESSRLLWEGEPIRVIAWSPDGTRIALRSRAFVTHVVDIATGALTTHADDVAANGQLLWLPAD
ncbi:MAG TPA: WD40 repeat domain-containing protein [Candidatus Limnocylindrales bacterium]